MLVVHADPQFFSEENFTSYVDIVEDCRQTVDAYRQGDVFGIDCGDLVGDKPELYNRYIDALDALWAHHRSLPRLNVKKQTGATDNFLNDLTKEPYAAAIATLGMQPEVDAVRATNDDYRAAAAADRRAMTAEQPVADIKAMRRTLVADYTALCNYIVTMANAYPDDVAWDELLTAINVIRKRYADLLARRAGTKKDEQS